MKQVKLLFVGICLCLFVLANALNASAAIAYCEKTGILGYSYGEMSKEQVVKLAFDMCIQSGGKEPKLIAYSEELGCAAIAYSKEPKVIGYCLGVDYLEIAKGDAFKMCLEKGGKNIQCIAEWHDKP